MSSDVTMMAVTLMGCVVGGGDRCGRGARRATPRPSLQGDAEGQMRRIGVGDARKDYLAGRNLRAHFLACKRTAG
jgi:hypothetical protein